MTLNENLNSKWKVSIRCICRNVAYVISSLPLSISLFLSIPFPSLSLFFSLSICMKVYVCMYVCIMHVCMCAYVCK